MKIPRMLLIMTLLLSAYGSSDSNERGMSPNCTKSGLFHIPDPGFCKNYFQCHYVPESEVFYPELLSCPDETYFDNSVSDCREASLVSNRSECLYNGSVSVHLADMISDTQGVCHRIDGIDHFERTVISTLNLRRSFNYAVKFNEYITDYNQDLEETQTHMGVWKKGNDILSQIKRIYELAKQYENEFDRKYDVNKDRLLTLSARRDTRILGLNEDITELKNDIQNIEAQLHKAGPLKVLLDARIVILKGRLNKKEHQILNTLIVALELHELVSFLEFASQDANNIIYKVVESRRRTDEFYTNIVKAKDTFGVYAINATSDMESLKTEDMKYEQQLRNKQNELANLLDKNDQLNAKEKELNRKVDDMHKGIQNLKDTLYQTLDFANKFKAWVCLPDWVFFGLFRHIDLESWRCDRILKHQSVNNDTEQLQEQIDDANKRLGKLTTELTNISPQFDIIDQNITTVRASIPAIENRRNEIKVEEKEFAFFMPAVQNLLQGIESALPQVLDTQEGLKKVEITFRLISEVLDKMINRASSAGDETEKQNAKTYVLKTLSSLQEVIDQSSEKISEVRTCSTLV